MDQAIKQVDSAESRMRRSREGLRIGIVGAGFGGIGLAILLKRSGFAAVTILERSGRIGGTWRDNTYPGAACDVQSHAYSFSFAPWTEWTLRYSGQAEILAYIDRVALAHGIMPLVKFNTTVTAAAFDESRQEWRVVSADGCVRAFDIFIPAVGQLSQPSIPDFPGLADFAGAYFHSARWDHSVALAGRRVALVGSAASAVQILPELTKMCAHVDVYQRTPNWIVPRNNGAYPAWRKLLFRYLPGYRWLLRQYLYFYGEVLFGAFRTGSWRNRLLKMVALRHLENQVQDPALRARLIPQYELGCKRVLFADDFYPCFSQPHVNLVTSRIERLERAGIRTRDGTLRDADAVVFATGFDVRNCLRPVSISGRDGVDLQSIWHDGPQAYRGVAVPGFPNMYIMYGPNTNLGHNSILVMLECQARYIVRCLERVVAENLATLEVSEVATRRYNDKLQVDLKQMVWSTGCGSWYESGSKITANWSGSTLEYGRMMKEVESGDFIAKKSA
jgi:cation diffusion facilitator CzcD-associated flavoprotein CzcO